MIISEIEWADWKLNPVTKAVFAVLRERHTSLMEGWANGEFTGSTIDQTAQLNAKAIGEAQGLARVLALDFEQVNGATE